jgi:glycosyltransferase involved in cell wall biosynthesis
VNTVPFVLLIPHYNNLEGLVKSLSSIHYTNKQFEVLIVDDGSKVIPDLSSLQTILPEVRIQLHCLSQNMGIAKALNEGLNIIQGRNEVKYIARLDCGDTCSPDRFNAQIHYLEEHPEVGLIGSWCKFEDKHTGDSYVYRSQTDDLGIRKEMHFRCSFIHPTVMFRKALLQEVGLYPENYPHAEDYIFFWRMLCKTQGYILPQVLVNIQTHGNNISQQFRQAQLSTRMRIIKEMASSSTLRYAGMLYVFLLRMISGRIVWKLKSRIMRK